MIASERAGKLHFESWKEVSDAVEMSIVLRPVMESSPFVLNMCHSSHCIVKKATNCFMVVGPVSEKIHTGL